MNENGSGSASRKKAVVWLVALVAIVAIAGGAYALVSQGTSPATGVGQGSQGAAAEGSSSASGSSGAAQGSGSAAPSASSATAAAPDVSVLDGSDASFKLSEIAQGKPLVVNFWATWCPYCIDEMADYQALYEKYGDRVAFVMLNAADSASEPAAARAYVQENGFTFPVYFDAAHEGVTSYRVNGLPTTVIIAADGSLVQNAPGRIDAAKLDAQLASLL